MAIQKSHDPRGFSDFEREGWDEVMAGYDRLLAPVTRQTVGATLDAAGVAQGMRVLDICTGPGVLAKSAVQRGATAVGLDFSEEAIGLARRAVPEAEFHQGDAQSLPFEDGSFDAVVCGYGVIHVPDPEKVLSEMRRVLRRGGRAALSVWDAPDPGNGFGLLFAALKQHGDLDVPLPHGPDFFQFSTEDAMAEAIGQVGFREVTVQKVEQVWRLDAPSAILQAILEGAVRARALLSAQTETALSAIEDAIAAGMKRFGTADGKFLVPMPALLGAGMK